MQLRRQQGQITPSEHFGDKFAFFVEDVGGDGESGKHELRLEKFVHVVQACHVWGAVTHHQIDPFPAEVSDDDVGRCLYGDVGEE
jgi:hypothetical protein